MHLNDNPEQAAYRTEARAWLEGHRLEPEAVARGAGNSSGTALTVLM